MVSAVYQIPRHTLVWLLLAHIAVTLPFIQQIPVWLSIIVGICLLWRALIFLGYWKFPTSFWKMVLFLAGIAAIFMGSKEKIGLSSSVGLLILAFSFKLLETQKERDVYVIVLLAYFVAAMQFLYGKSLLSFVYVLGCLLFITAALTSVSHNLSNKPMRRTLKLSAVLLIQSIPLAIILFVFFPRMAPFLSLEDPKQHAQIGGMGDSMTPGDVADLSRSDALAFRVEFKGSIPDSSQLYWRSVVLSEFDGQTWSVDWPLIQYMKVNWHPQKFPPELFLKNDPNQLSPLDYVVLLEPTQNYYLVGLDRSIPITENVGLTHDFHLLAKKSVNSPFRYELNAFLNAQIGKDLPTWIYTRELELPLVGNPKSRALAKQWIAEAQGNPVGYIHRVLTWFRQGSFVYTLKPGTLSGNTIDRFLFETKAGFCAHYAGAFVYLMRSAGIPARVVAGYQGGELNPLGHYLLVHQYDAHAWAEVWLENQGWVRVDPTAFVAPDRINKGAEQTTAVEESQYGFNLWNLGQYRNNVWVKKVRLSFDYINYIWNQNVVNYNQEKQEKWLSKNFNLTTWYERILWMIGLLGAVLLLVAAYLFWSKKSIKRNAWDELYRQFCQRMALEKIARKLGESPNLFCQRIKTVRPDLYPGALQITELYLQNQYCKIEGQKGVLQVSLHQMRQLIRRMPHG